MEYSLCYDIGYKLVFVFIWLSFGDTNKRREQPYSIVLLLYPFRPSLTAGVLEVGLNNADNMTDQRQPWEQRSSCEGNMSSSAWLSTSTAGDINVYVFDSYPGGAHPGDYNQYSPIVTLPYCVCVVWRQCHAKCN